MAAKSTTLFLPEEDRIISSWLKVEPKVDLPEDLTLETALENLGLNQEVSVLAPLRRGFSCPPPAAGGITPPCSPTTSLSSWPPPVPS